MSSQNNQSNNSYNQEQESEDVLKAIKLANHNKFTNESNQYYPRVQSSQDGVIKEDIKFRAKKPLKLAKAYDPNTTGKSTNLIINPTYESIPDKPSLTSVDMTPSQSISQNQGSQQNISTSSGAFKGDDGKIKSKLSSTEFTPSTTSNAAIEFATTAIEFATTATNATTVSSTMLTDKSRKPLSKKSHQFQFGSTNSTKSEPTSTSIATASTDIITNIASPPMETIKPEPSQIQLETSEGWNKALIKPTKTSQSPENKQQVQQPTNGITNTISEDKPISDTVVDDTTTMTTITSANANAIDNDNVIDNTTADVNANVNDNIDNTILPDKTQVNEVVVVVAANPIVEQKEVPEKIIEKEIETREKVEVPEEIKPVEVIVPAEISEIQNNIPSSPGISKTIEVSVKIINEPAKAKVYTRKEIIEIISQYKDVKLSDPKLQELKNRETRVDEPIAFGKNFNLQTNHATSLGEKKLGKGKGGKGERSKTNIIGGYQKPFEKEPPKVATQQEQPSISRSTKEPAKVPEVTFQRIELTPEELALKQKIKSQANVWMSEMKKEKDPLEAIEKEIRLSLNKLTPDNFDKIKEEILKLGSQSHEACMKVADLILEKAWTEKHYCKTYAKLCDFLGKADQLFFPKKEDGDKKPKKNTFKLQISSKIQKVFEDEAAINLKNVKKPEEMNKEEKELYYQRKKQKILGNVNFIAQLYIEKFFILQIVRICTSTLIAKFLNEYAYYIRNQGKIEIPTHEDNLEGLIKFYEQIGKMVEEKEKSKEKAKGAVKKEESPIEQFIKCLQTANNPKVENIPQFTNEDIGLDDFFKILEHIKTKAKLTSRMQALVVNLEFRRQNNWIVPEYHNQGPKTIKDVHNEYEREREESERRASEYYDDYASKKKMTSYDKKEYIPTKIQSDEIPKSRDSQGITKDIDIPTKIEITSFKPKRGKTSGTGGVGGSDILPTEKTKIIQYGAQDLEKFMKEAYTNDDAQIMIKDIMSLIHKSSQENFLNVFFKTFHDAKYDLVKLRIPIIKNLLEAKLITDEVFLSRFSAGLSKGSEYDSPYYPEFMARVFLDYITLSDKNKINNIKLKEDITEDWLVEILEGIYTEFATKLSSLIKGEYSPVSNKLSQADIQSFEERISEWKDNVSKSLS